MLLTTGPADPLFEFGAFVADPVAGRLYYSGHDVPLTPKSFKVLMVLIGSGGQLVDREELFRQVWPDTFVEPNNLARNVSMIRKALHERDSDHEYIVTVSGRGYRFVAPTSEIPRAELAHRVRRAVQHEPESVARAVLPPEAEATAFHAGQATPRAPTRWEAACELLRRPAQSLSVAALLVALTGSAGAFLFASLTRPENPTRQPRLWQLTSAGRLDGEPTWSPDGQSVAYSSDRDGSFKIWTQSVGGGSPVQITFGPARDWQPSWSPEGRHIAFRSERDGGGLFVVAIAGAGARRVANFGHQPKWSPDGSRILFCDGRDIYTVGLDAAAPSQVAREVLSSASDRCRVAWHPDGRRISVYKYDRRLGWGFWTVPITGGPHVVSRLSAAVEQRLSDADLQLGGFAWAPGGDALYFEGRSERTQNLWRIGVDPRTLKWIAGPDRLTTSSGLESGPAVSPDGKRLAFGSRFERTSVWSLPFDPVSGQITGTGHAITPEGANAKILDVSPDGTQLVYRVSSRHADELWIRSLEHQAERLRKVEFGADIVHPRWSRDGMQLAYLRRPENRAEAAAIVLLAADGEEQQLLPTAESPEMVYDWGPDGSSLLVRCRADELRSAICRMSMASRAMPEMHVIAADPDRDLYAAAYSPDGRWVSFIAAPDLSRSAVFIVPSTGGAWQAVTDSADHAFNDLPRWSPDGRTLYFLSNRTGFWNLWGRRFDSDPSGPMGQPFQVSRFDSTVRMVGPVVSALQIAITRDRLILPVTETSGAVWILDSSND